MENSPVTTPDRKNYYNDAEEPTESEKVINKLKRLNISSLTHTFESYKAITDNKNALEIMQEVARGNSDRKFILLYGGPGTGKTHLIEATIIEWAKAGILCYYRTFSDIARFLKGGLRIPDLYTQRFNTIRDTRKLIIDDFGMGTTESRFEISDLEDIIDLRYRRRYYPDSKEITIMGSNKDIKELPDRVLSRFYDPEFGVVIYMGDKDYRRRKA